MATLQLRRRRRRIAFGIACALLAFGSAREAGAEPSGDWSRSAARALADEAANSYARGDYVQANQLLTHAYELVPAPTIALLQARTLVRLRRFVEATEVYNRAARAELNAESPPVFVQAAEEADKELVTLLPRVPKIKISVSGVPPDDPALRVLVDDHYLSPALLGAWVPADPTTHSIRVTHTDGWSRTETVSLQEGERRLVLFDAAPRPRSNSGRTLGLVSIGVGGVGLTLGVATGIAALNAHDDAEAACQDSRCLKGSPGADALDRFETYRTISTVGYAVGAVGVGLGVFLLLRSSEPSKPSVAITPTLSGVRLVGAI